MQVGCLIEVVDEFEVDNITCPHTQGWARNGPVVTECRGWPAGELYLSMAGFEPNPGLAVSTSMLRRFGQFASGAGRRPGR